MCICIRGVGTDMHNLQVWVQRESGLARASRDNGTTPGTTVHVIMVIRSGERRHQTDEAVAGPNARTLHEIALGPEATKQEH